MLVLLSLAATGHLLHKGTGWGAYGDSFGFGALMTAAALPFGMALAAATTIPQLLQVIPAGAKVGRSRSLPGKAAKRMRGAQLGP
ncbi:hypothetical protein AV521_18275 [Streptomyces sp. IMTB 2501]|uniref:hypothetical protein n=1 Tax=Streptomyces sp. IMTB 2501 TaxID=1776340 RepID=UPI00096D65BF|nr:hypothetical protein [Streptomyces sp. IMTB 2501]OLZ69463.1 hypothetical protein AV521_18275 [Streptomyces sp. IMTB 2501]